MKILFDIRVTQKQSTRGIGLYFISLIMHLSKFPIEISILAEKGNKIPFSTEFVKSIEIIYISDLNTHDLSNRKFDFLFIDDMIFMKNYNIKTFFDELFPEKIMMCTDQIVTILFDTIYIFNTKPENKTAYTRLAIQLESLNIANHFFSISENTKNDFIKHLKIKPENITTVYGGIGLKTQITPTPYDMSMRKDHIVSILGEDSRKNIEGLIKGFAIALKYDYIPTDSILYICFKISDVYRKKLSKLIKNNSLNNNQIIITGFISEEELIKLISTAKGTIFPSFYEGLGLPILESYAIGTPCFSSNTSSMTELVLPECTFDPHDKYSIALAIKQLFTNFQLCQKSVQFGEKLIQNTMNWDCTSEKVFTKLLALKKAFYKPYCNTAVFGVLPPEKTGIANFNAKTFSISRHFHVYSKFTKYDYYYDATNNITKENNFFPIDIYPIASSLFNYGKKIFVLGNSPHNIPYLKAAIEEKDKENSFLYCHEIMLNNLLYNLLKEHDYNQIKKTVYPSDSKNNYGFRAILLLTNISKIIVNNNNSKQLLLEEIKNTIYEDIVSVSTVFLPVTEISLKADDIPVDIDFAGFKIGSFGICNKKKATDIIIRSVVLLNEEYGIEAKCILAGYDVDNFIQSQIPSKLHKYILSFSNSSDDQLLSIMKQVDIAVQLRNYQYGESSGVICQLLGLNKRIIVSENFIDERFENYCTVVPRFISKDELAKVFYDVFNKNISIDASVLLKNFGFNNLAEAILKI
jgi:glycosyltransferase involved in cell wall biosynthesis